MNKFPFLIRTNQTAQQLHESYRWCNQRFGISNFDWTILDTQVSLDSTMLLEPKAALCEFRFRSQEDLVEFILVTGGNT